MSVIYTVLLTDGTTGTIDTLNGQSASEFLGEFVAVNLHDENGNPITAYGVLAEVLDIN